MEALTQEELDALEAYQTADGVYELVNSVLRGTVQEADLDEASRSLAADVIAGVSSAVRKHTTPQEVLVWRGLSNLEVVFGVRPEEAGRIVGTSKRLAGFSSTTLDREVAEIFLDPSEGALLHVLVPQGVHAAWLPVAGSGDYVDELELLLEEDLVYTVTEASQEGDILILECEVRQ